MRSLFSKSKLLKSGHVHRGIVELVALSAGFLGLVHGDISVLDQMFRNHPRRSETD